MYSDFAAAAEGVEWKGKWFLSVKELNPLESAGAHSI